jgi:hypothetical protein
VYSANAAAGLLAGKPEALHAAVAGHLARSLGVARPAALRQVAELFRALPDDLKERLLDAAFRVLASDDKDDTSLRELAAELPPDAALKALRQLAQGGMRLSPHAMRLLHTLMAAAQRARRERDASRASSSEETRAVVAELMTLFQDEDVDRFNPEDHEALLDSAAIDPQDLKDSRAAGELGERADSLTETALEHTLLLTLIELAGAREALPLDAPLERLQALFRDALSAGQFTRALEIVDSVRTIDRDEALPAANKKRLGEFLARLAEPELLASLLNAPHKAGASPAQVKELIARLGSAAARGLLENLAAEQDQKKRRRLFDLIVSLGSVIVPDATRMLRDTRWYVVRNMIVLLRRVGDKGSLPEIRRCAEDRDLRVRLEAIKTLLVQDPSVPRGLLDKAILDKDPKLAESAVVLVGQYGIKEGTQPLLSILSRWDLFGSQRSLRLKALKALADLGDASVLPRLERFFGGGFLPPIALEERRAAFKALEGYPEDARRPFVDKGLYSKDSAIRDACQRLLRSAPPVSDRTLVPSAAPPPGGAP